MSTIRFGRNGSNTVAVGICAIEINDQILIDNGTTPQDTPNMSASACSVGTKSGFSIIKYQGAGSGSANTDSNLELAHGLTQAPYFIIGKRLNSSNAFMVYHSGVAMGTMNMSSTAANDASSFIWGHKRPTRWTIPLGNNPEINGSGNDYIMYAWHNVPGLQKFGSFSGNNSTDGSFIDLGFRPALAFIKRTGSTGNWFVLDSSYGDNTYNPIDEYAYCDIANNYNPSNGGPAAGMADFVHNGIKLREDSAGTNEIDTYIYCAWAETPSFNLFGGLANAR